MPVATVTRNTERFDLTTAPPDGYVIVRRMTFGEKLHRQDELMQIHAPTTKDSNYLEMAMMNKKAALQDFSNLIVEHNLTDESGRMLNFRNANDVASLDPRIGDEISVLIDGINAFEETSEVKN